MASHRPAWCLVLGEGVARRGVARKVAGCPWTRGHSDEEGERAGEQGAGSSGCRQTTLRVSACDRGPWLPGMGRFQHVMCGYNPAERCLYLTCAIGT